MLHGAIFTIIIYFNRTQKAMNPVKQNKFSVDDSYKVHGGGNYRFVLLHGGGNYRFVLS